MSSGERYSGSGRSGGEIQGYTGDTKRYRGYKGYTVGEVQGDRYSGTITVHLTITPQGKRCRERGKSALTLLAHTFGTKPVATTKPSLCWCDW